MHFPLYVSIAFELLPLQSFAANVAAPTSFAGLVNVVTNIIGMLVVFIFSLTFLAFMWGVIKGWIINGGDTEGVESGKKVVLVGVIALVIMSSVWGILYLLKNSLFGG